MSKLLFHFNNKSTICSLFLLFAAQVAFSNTNFKWYELPRFLFDFNYNPLTYHFASHDVSTSLDASIGLAFPINIAPNSLYLGLIINDEYLSMGAKKKIPTLK